MLHTKFLHAKFCGNLDPERIFDGLLPYMGMAAILVM